MTTVNSNKLPNGVEKENLGAVTLSQDQKINIDLRSPTVSNVVARLENHEIDLCPEFQRKKGLWGKPEQSRLIESILLQIPLPAFYFVEAPAEINGIPTLIWQVVDGLQRLCTFENFFVRKNDDPRKLRLQGLNYLEDCNGKTYEELSRIQRRTIDETQLTVHLIKYGTSTPVKYNIFERVNTGGKPLNQQEIRHAINQGPATRLLEELAESKQYHFREATSEKVSSVRMLDRELVNRFLAFYLLDIEDYTDMESFLDKVLVGINKGVISEGDVLRAKNAFGSAMQAAMQMFGEFAFRKVINGKPGPINKTLFEVFSVCIAKLSNSIREKLSYSMDVSVAYREFVMQGSKFEELIHTSTGHASRVRARHVECEQFLNELGR